MKPRFLLCLLALASAGCCADGLPAIGVVEQVPVMADGASVSARPVYILTNRKLAVPTLFSALQGSSATYTVACCFEVRNTTPLALNAELARYARDPEFVAHMKSVKGYRYAYAAQPSADKSRWTPLMKTLAANAANPDDASPFSAPVVAAQFGKPRMPAAFGVDGAALTLQVRSDRKTGRSVYVFIHGREKTEFSEDSLSD